MQATCLITDGQDSMAQDASQPTPDDAVSIRWWWLDAGDRVCQPELRQKLLLYSSTQTVGRLQLDAKRRSETRHFLNVPS